MNNKYFAMLPKLNANSAVNPDKAGIWEKETGAKDFLPALVKSLAAGGSFSDLGSIDSIPDVWARPLLFQMALFDDKRSGAQEFVRGLHDKVEGEWRALLAMLALKEMRYLNLRSKAVHLGSGYSDMENVLKAMAPKETISSDTSWNDVYIICYQDKPLALTSPTTLVAPAADYQRAFEGVLAQPWSADGSVLTDPIPYLTADELGALATWLGQLETDLRAAIPQHEQGRSQSCLSLLEAIDSYKRDIFAKHGALPSGQRFQNAGLDLNIGVFRALNRTIEAKGATVSDSAVRLVTSKEREGTKSVILVSPQMARDFAAQEGVGAAQLVVWPGVSANDVTEEALAGDRSHIGAQSLKGAQLYRPEEFFTERMTVMEPGDALKGTMKVPGSELLSTDDLSAILPFKKELLEFFTPDEIAKRTRIENLSDRITVQFSFPLSGVHGQADYKCKRDYPKQELIYLQTNVPVIELWPNMKREGWDKYYLYYENSDAQVEAKGTGRDFFYVSPWKYGKDIASEVPERGLQNLFTARLSGFPEAFLCTVNVTSDDGIYAEAIEGGILLMEEPQRVAKVPRLKWQVGIDFGTSSTMLYVREGSHTTRPLHFEPNLLPVTDSGVSRALTFINFIPSSTADQTDGSFLSIFQLLNPDSLKTEIRPIQDGNVYWLFSASQAVNSFVNRIGQIDANLKWKNDDIGRRKVAAYVKQVCLQSLVEAAKAGAESVEWNFSYPTAFSAEQQFAFKATCREAVEEAYEETGFGQEEAPQINIWAESKASAYHFNKLGTSATNFSEGAICLDIGAGTTDVSIISGQPARIVYHTSLQLAGRYLFAPIYRSYELFGGDVPDLGGLDEEHRNAIIDADMRQNSEAYLKNLKNMTGRPEIRRVLQEVQLGMAGVFYYLGGLLKKLSEKGIYEENHLPDIYVGGNGSRVFSWLSGGSFDESNPFLAVFMEILSSASGLKRGYGSRLKLSEHPKVEVASGMIEERPHNDAEFFDEERQKNELFGEGVGDEYLISAQLSGDAYSLEGGEKAADDFISAYDIADGVEVKELKALTSFFEDFNQSQHRWSETVELDEALYHKVLREVRSHYISQKGLAPKKIFVEPVFVVELKKYMEMLK